ncbi:hypothetical protein Hrd1104_02380 [Halorhabdus sp. CBA1104]|uniref:DUF7287 family protein n=1 Tax=Halorhabdus sp. CBA1104 TaxID=1380432 RepID=UPI0012B2E4C7|nr:hypothetical protein [Halorhabdus sp. CBA1104]QGN06248.1 hypothetical protein Hrd1104_02380 [Halorhabdus sp. CBA1104]
MIRRDSKDANEKGWREADQQDRAQTMQDFVLGISIFMIGFMFVLALFPGLLTPFESSLDGNTEAAADRVTAEIVSNFSKPAEPNVLNATRLNQTVFNDSRSVADLKSQFGLPSDTGLNITLQRLDGMAHLNASGNPVTNDRTAISVRIVDTGFSGCDPGCRLVVRTW